MRRLYLYMLLAPILLPLALPLHAGANDGNIKVLLIGSHGRGAAHWITLQSFCIENLLHFNGIPYDFFDIYTGSLGQSTLDSYGGVVLEGNAIRWDATEEERVLLADNMDAGNITVLLGLINGQFSDLNNTIYGAMDISVNGQGNSEHDIGLLAGASKVYDYPGDYGFIVVGGPGGKHLGMAVHSLGEWMYTSSTYGDGRAYGVEFALKTWLENAYGADARVTLPLISLRLDDTETTAAPRNQTVMSFIDSNKHLIRASGYLVTDASAYQISDSLRRHDEQTISQWGSMSLHGKDHASVGAEGENQDYAMQYAETNAAVSVLEQNFPRYKPIKACPNNSWNEATLHAMCANGIFYHSAYMGGSDHYKALYKRLFDVDSEMEREKMNTRLQTQLRYYPLADTDETGEARVYSMDWAVAFAGTQSGGAVLPILKGLGLDWKVPLLVGAHFYLPGSGGANNDPQGWMSIMTALMSAVDAYHYPWRRWVDGYDFAQNLQRFDQDLRVNGISVAGDVITFDITADPPIRFMTLQVGKAWHCVESVTVNGSEYFYFGDDYVHLPEIDGDAVVVVRLTSQHVCQPHVTHISPSAVIEDAQCEDGKLRLAISGEFAVTASVAGSSRVFRNTTTQVFPDRTESVHADASSQGLLEQVGLSLAPSIGWVDVVVGKWETSDTRHRTWTETDYPEPEGCRPPGFHDIRIEHTVGDLEPNSRYFVKAAGLVVDTCLASASGEISFLYCSPWTTKTMDVVFDSTELAGLPPEGSPAVSGPVEGASLAICPNPLESTARISYELPQSSRVILDIYSVDGWLVCRLVDDVEQAGRHSLEWDGRDGRHNRVSPGLYFCRLRMAGGTETCKIALLR